MKQQPTKQRILFTTLTVASAIGFLASFLQTIEKLTLLKNPESILVCNINAVFSCTNILNSWQSSVFGFPNSLMCIIFFVIMMTAGIVGWTGGTINSKLRLVFLAMALFFVSFGFWYLWQSIFIIGSMCVYCIFCYGGVLVASDALLRLSYKDIKLNNNLQKTLSRMIANKADIVLFTSIALIIVLEIIIKFT